ncbi:MAG: peptidylprolyl isomerase [Acidimicrobiales bacterium]|nr:peptidylprolyl isomerase [Acidimicrobiales bacterium]
MHFSKLFSVSVGLAVALVTALLISCGSDETPSEESSPSSASTVSSDAAASPTVEATSEQGETPTISQEVLFSIQIAEALIGGPVGGESESCLFASAQSNPDFADAISAVLSNQAQLSGIEFSNLVTGVRDCVGFERMNEAIAIGLSLGEGSDDLFQCLMKQTADSNGDAAFVGLAAVTVQYPIPPEYADATVETLTTCVPDDLLANQLSLQYLQTRNFSVDVDLDCLTSELASSGIAPSFWEAAFLTQDAEQLAAVAALVTSCEKALHEGLLTSVPEDFVPWEGQRALTEVAPPARNNAYSEAPPMTIDTSGPYQAIITTADGDMTFDLLEDTAPNTVNNFVNLTEDGYYDGVIFHRVIEGFMAQGGDPTGQGTGGPGYQFGDEVDDGPAMESRGLLAMANAGRGTNGSQFFITFEPTPHLTGNHTIFGTLTNGDDVLSAIDLRDPASPASHGEVILEIRIIGP